MYNAHHSPKAKSRELLPNHHLIQLISAKMMDNPQLHWGSLRSLGRFDRGLRANSDVVKLIGLTSEAIG